MAGDLEAQQRRGGVEVDEVDVAPSRPSRRRDHLDLSSDEVLAQILDRGELAAWRELYRLAARPGPEGAELRRRIVHLCRTVPLGFPHLFLAAMRALGERIEPYPTVPEPRDDVA